ncbi:DUF3987 domain-containing protein [Arcobacter arenosus]|uniref:DUF3987 domain-containing protein n=1 Tax=Arcobacter arenosus TaxID=2576037 RepID=UPI003BA96800
MNNNIINNNSANDISHMINIEKSVLSSFLFEPNLFERVHNELNQNSFCFESHKLIFDCMKKLHEKGFPIDEDFIRKYVDKRVSDTVLIDLMSCNPITNVKSYIKQIQENHKQRELQSISFKINQLILKSGSDEAIKNATLELNKISSLYEEKEKKTKDNSIINLDKLSPFLSNLVKDLIKINDYPASMVLSTVLASMAGLIGARAQITNNINITVYPVIWSIIVAPSSLAAKSTLYRYTKKSIFGNLQNELYEEYEGKLEQYKIDMKNYRELSKEDKRNEIEPEKPEPKLLVFQNDGTPEAKIKSLQDNQNGGIVYYDEMRAELEKTNNDKSYKALKTSVFDGELLHKRLVNGGSIILKRPVLCEVGLITEQWLLEVVNKNDIASGFMARYLFSYNTRSDFNPLQIKDFVINTDIYAEVGNFIINMFDFDREQPVLFELSKEAKEFYKKWFNEYSVSVYETETDEEITSTYRLTTYVLKFALISYIFNNSYQKIDVVKSDNMLEIPLEYIKEGIYIMEIFTEENHKILQLFQKNKMLNFKINSIAEKVQKKIRASKDKKISKTEATTGIRDLTAEKLDELIEQGLFKSEKIDRTTYIYEVV